MIACSNEAEVSEETVVNEQLPAWGASPVVEEEVAEEEYRAGVADSVVDAL
jgi:hypothetical protein